jgi:predicted ATPase
MAVDLLRREAVRLLTLTGAGGVGKTRLAVEVAGQLRTAFSDGVVWIPLASLNDSSLVPSAIARALRIRETDDLQEILTATLRGREILLLLDNFEQVAEAAPFVSDLVSSCPEAKVLVTSRVALRLRVEQELAISPLRLPDATQQTPVYAIAANPAVDLFLRRAQAVNPDFALTEGNAGAVTEICRRLDGIPLALELAAARIRVLSPQAMLRRLDHRLSFLTGGGPDLPARQRAMRETIAWSYGLLEPSEQMLFRRLAIFAGSCDLRAIEAVCATSGDLPVDMLDVIEALQRSSLLQLAETADDEPRVVMLETVREYAREMLVESGEEAELQERHARYYLSLVGEGPQHFLSPAQGRWLDRVGREHDNLRAALQWCIEQSNAETGLRLTAGLWPLWYVRGYSEGRMWLTTILALPGADTPTAPRAGSLLGASQLALARGDYAAAHDLSQESLDLYRFLGDERGVCEGLLVAGFAARLQEQHDVARTLLSEALTISRATQHAFITAAALHHLGIIEAVTVGDHAGARCLLEESLAAYRALGLPRFIALVLFSLGDLARADGQYVRAAGMFREGLIAMVEVGEKPVIAGALDSFAHLAMDQGQAERTVKLSAAAARSRSITGLRAGPTTDQDRERWLARARSVLGDEAFGAAWAAGEALTEEQSIAYALDEALSPETESRNGRTSHSSY